MTLISRLDDYPAIQKLVQSCLRVWPEHEKFLAKSLDETDEQLLRHRDDLAKKVDLLVGSDAESFCRDYRWVCEQVKQEQLYFHRHGHYRLKTIEEAIERVYGVPEYMGPYVNGLLISQVFWRNHSAAFYLYKTEFIPTNKPQYDHVDIGPGHGLFMGYNAEDPGCRSLTGWDVSPSSLKATELSLKRLGVQRPVTLAERDVTKGTPTSERFDSVIMSEILEHLEDPTGALRFVKDVLRPGGRLFINVPCNSPALDHLYLWNEPAEVLQTIQDAGLETEKHWAFPVTGHSLESAKRLKLDISCIVICRKPELAN